MDEKKWFFLIVIFFSISQILFIKLTPFPEGWNTYSHFLISKGTSEDFSLFLDQWGKPLFTLVTSQFAYVGMAAYRLSTMFMGILSILVIYSISKKLNQRYPLIPPLLIGFSPLTYYLFSDGTVEALAILMILTSIYLYLKENYVWSAITMSLLFFVRSDGVVLIGVWGIIYLVKKKWKAIPWFAYSIGLFSILTGVLVKEPLYFLTHSPYLSSWATVYLPGDPWWFFKTLVIVTGIFPVFLILPSLKNIKKNLLFIIPSFVIVAFHSLILGLGILAAFEDMRFFGMALPFIFILSGESLNVQLNRFWSHIFLIINIIIGGYVIWMINNQNSITLLNKQSLILLMIILSVLSFYILFRFPSIRIFALFSVVLLVSSSLLLFHWYLINEYNQYGKEDKYSKIACDFVLKNFPNSEIKFYSPFVNYYLNLSIVKSGFSQQTIDALGVGSIIIYDTHTGPNEAMVPLRWITSHPRLEKKFEVAPNPPFKTLNGYDFKVMVFQVVK